MPDQINLSQPAWILLDMLQQQLGVWIEVLDMSMRPTSPSGVVEGPSATAEPRIAAEVLKSLRTGELRIDRGGQTPIGIFPLRIAKEIAGCLLVTARAGRPEDVNIESAGYLARTALEGDLALTTQLADVRYRNRRVHGILRFLAQVGAIDAERDVMHAVVQAATLWFDADCRIYNRQPDGSFTLAAVLPGVDGRAASPRLEQSRVDKLLASRRFSSAGDLEDLGFGGRREEVLVLPVGDVPAPDWVLILAGNIDHEVELTFGAMAKVLASELQAREAARVARWATRLAEAASGERRAPERTLLTMVEALAADVGASSARVTLVRDHAERALAALGERQRPEGAEAEAAVREETTFTDSVAVAPGGSVRLTLTSSGDPRAAALQAASWIRALQPWLHEAVARLTEFAPLFETIVDVPSFETRIQEEVERAKRFNLGLGLVLISPGAEAPRGAPLEPVMSTLRSELRASDLMGRIREGLVAVLLVHAQPAGAESVIARLRHRLCELPEEDRRMPALHVGRAIFSADTPSAEALIAQAKREARRLELQN